VSRRKDGKEIGSHDMQALRNQRYCSAFGHELRQEPLGRVFLNEAVVMYRKTDGTPVAFEDRCCIAPNRVGATGRGTAPHSICATRTVVISGKAMRIATVIRSQTRNATPPSPSPLISGQS